MFGVGSWQDVTLALMGTASFFARKNDPQTLTCTPAGKKNRVDSRFPAPKKEKGTSFEVPSADIINANMN